MLNITVDIYADTACPWCYLGNRYLDLAINQFRRQHPDVDFELVWHPFVLFPAAKGSEVDTHREKYTKAYGRTEAAALFRRLEKAGNEVGIEFDWSGRAGDTADSHKLLLWASEASRERRSSSGGVAEPAAPQCYPSPPRSPQTGDRGDGGGAELSGLQLLRRELYCGVFELRRDVSDRAFLARAGVAAGLAPEQADVLAWLDNSRAAAWVDKHVAASADRASGVPSFVVQGRFKVGGAQPPEVFLQLFERVRGGGLT